MPHAPCCAVSSNKRTNTIHSPTKSSVKCWRRRAFPFHAALRQNIVENYRSPVPLGVAHLDASSVQQNQPTPVCMGWFFLPITKGLMLRSARSLPASHLPMTTAHLKRAFPVPAAFYTAPPATALQMFAPSLTMALVTRSRSRLFKSSEIRRNAMETFPVSSSAKEIMYNNLRKLKTA